MKIETGWLIEKQVSGRAVWWAGGNGYDWTVDACDAMRFCRKQDAEAILKLVAGLNLLWWDDAVVIVTDHMWTDDSE